MARYQILVTEPNQPARTIEVLHDLTVGRARASDVVLQDDEVSREQLKIVLAGEALSVRSIGKTNVTAVDGRPVSPGSDAPLRAGSRITAGRTLIEVQAVAQAADGGPGDATMAGATRVGKVSDPPTAGATMQLPIGPRGGKPAPAPTPATPATPPPPPRQEPLSEGATLQLPVGPRGAKPAPAAPTPTPPPPPQQEPLSEGATLQLPVGPRGAKPAPAAPTPPPSTPKQEPLSEGATLHLPAGPRGAKPAPAAPTPTPPPPPQQEPLSEGATLQLPAGPRGAKLAAAAPTPTPPPPPPAKPAPASESATLQIPSGPRLGGAAPPPQAAAPAPPSPAQPAPAPASGSKVAQPSTVALATVDIDDAANQRLAVLTMQAGKLLPRLFVRSRSLRRSMRIAGPCARVGRSDTCDLVVADESVSENHAEILFDGMQWSVRDLGSRNGTNVDGQSVTGDSRPIVRNTVLRFGAVHAVFLVDDPARLLDDLRHEARAMRHLLRTGKLTKDEGRHVLDRVHSEGLGIPEVVLKETAVDIAAWVDALLATAKRTLLDRLLDVFRGVPRPGSAS